MDNEEDQQQQLQEEEEQQQQFQQEEGAGEEQFEGGEGGAMDQEEGAQYSPEGQEQLAGDDMGATPGDDGQQQQMYEGQEMTEEEMIQQQQFHQMQQMQQMQQEQFEDDGEGDGGQEDEEYGQEMMAAQHHHEQQQQQQYYQQHHYEDSPDGNGASPGGDEEGHEGYMQSQMSNRGEQIEQEHINEKISKIIQICKENDALFGDSEFPASDQSLYKDPSNPPEYSQDCPEVDWKRPHEIAPAPEEAALIKDGMNPGDVKQGILGDCWLLGSLLILSTHPDLLKNLIVYDGLEFGFAVFQFFKNGRWQYVIVDSRIPFNSSAKTPLYGHCADPNEFWVPLMEKAYAKLHGTFEDLNGGSMAESLVDLTGGASEKYNLRAPEIAEMIETQQFWKDIKKYHSQGFLIGCSNVVKDENGNKQDGAGQTGILFNHAYGILDVRELDGLQLVRIRNPWGQGEWTGKFADEDEAWDDYKGLKEKLNYVFRDDGTWWMRYEDWCIHFNKMYLTKIFPQAWTQFSITSEWRGNTSGGPYPVQADRDEENKDANVKLDTNDRWFNNPQFRISVTKKTQLIISLMQEDEKISKRPYIPVNFMVVRVKSRRDRLWEVDRDDIVLQAAEGGQRFEQREITKTTWLSPIHDKKNVHYIIVPNTELENKNEQERPFFLRIFASEQIEVVQLPNTIEQQFAGKWIQATAGGKRVMENGKENQFWCRNPQYFLNITKPTHLKIILKKKGGRRVKVPIGITVTKALPPTAPPAAKIIRPGKDTGGARTMASSVGKTSQYAQTLKKIQGGGDKADKIPEFEPPKLENLERKLKLLPGEWYEETYYCSDDVAALYAFYQPTQGPFIIIPSMLKDEITADFTLNIFSSQPVEVKKLEDSKNVVHSGKWAEKSAGGCHLYDKEFEQKVDKFTWVNNPKFHMKLQLPPGEQTTSVKIILTRPENAWKKQIGMSLVGCMIGFYVYPASQNPSKDNLINKATQKFVPWNEVAEELQLEGIPEGYVIMPTTYEPNKFGPFIMSVSTDVEFTLVPLE